MILLRLLAAAIFAILIAGIAVAFEAGLVLLLDHIFDANLQPRGIGWIVLPVTGGIAGWKIGWNFEFPFALLALAHDWIVQTRYGRAFLLLCSAWFLGWTIYTWNSDTFASYYGWTSEDWENYAGGLVGLPAIVLGVVWATKWVFRGKPN